MSLFDVVVWRQGKVRMLDQRLLPDREIYLEYTSAAEVAEAIRSMVIRGAPAIGCAAAFGVAVEAHRLAQQGVTGQWEQALEPGCAALLASRPTAINLGWAVARMRQVIALHPTPATLPARLLAEAETIHREDVASCRAIGQHGASLIHPPDNRPLTIMTHCNAGALATAGYGTALGVIRAAHDADKSIRVIACETRPYLQGARLTAWELVKEGIHTTLITDSMAGHLMSQGEIDMIVVGADRIAANGDAANKIGTYTHAVLANRNGIPFLVAAPLSTIDLNTLRGSEIPIEERPPEEVTHFQGRRVAAEGVHVRNPAFDVTPAELISAIITEKGVVRNPNKEKIKALFDS
ncbi:MAG: S-methyl-5-thioribose-1-phosphate isomerase [Magnetococcales bacterium]|nr:S-methyl-5-thioribose-1-phosphate isomerase [Magnetococcales bacterium]MBF0322500.1 S-methyl-5-thioribose-1-phosphate isomerase [Magnetococcales bacterium]